MVFFNDIGMGKPVTDAGMRSGGGKVYQEIANLLKIKGEMWCVNG